MSVSQQDKAMVLSLVEHHLSGPRYLQYVKGHTRMRCTPPGVEPARCEVLTVGNHVRALAMSSQSRRALRCTCKLHALTDPVVHSDKMRVTRRAWEERSSIRRASALTHAPTNNNADESPTTLHFA